MAGIEWAPTTAQTRAYYVHRADVRDDLPGSPVTEGRERRRRRDAIDDLYLVFMRDVTPDSDPLAVARAAYYIGRGQAAVFAGRTYWVTRVYKLEAR